MIEVILSHAKTLIRNEMKAVSLQNSVSFFFVHQLDINVRLLSN